MAKEKAETKEEVKPTRKVTSLVSGAKFHDFDETPVYEGVYTDRAAIAEEDDEKNNRKKGDIMGYFFENEEGETIIGASHAIEKAILKTKDMGIKNPHLVIEFLEKVEREGKRPFNRYKIDLIED